MSMYLRKLLHSKCLQCLSSIIYNLYRLIFLSFICFKSTIINKINISILIRFYILYSIHLYSIKLTNIFIYIYL
nr:MAG TPA: hypothetical protein [Crassvirales sp.]